LDQKLLPVHRKESSSSPPLLKELIWFAIKIPVSTPTVCYKVFEDDVGDIELAKAPKLRPLTKHIAIQYHYFHTHVAKPLITSQHLMTMEQASC
jgi:hypothetical protein